jgi:hypothetical protein
MQQQVMPDQFNINRRLFSWVRFSHSNFSTVEQVAAAAAGVAAAGTAAAGLVALAMNIDCSPG